MHLSKTFAAASWFIRAASNSGCRSSGPPDALEGSSEPSSMWEQQWRLRHPRSLERASQINTPVPERAQTHAMTRATARASNNLMWKMEMFVDKREKRIESPDSREFQALATCMQRVLFVIAFKY